MFFLLRAINFINKFIYTKETILLFSYDKSNKKEYSDENIIVKKVNNNNVYDCLAFQKNFYLKKFLKFLKDGDIGYYAYLNDKCVHRSWVKLGKGKKFKLNYFFKRRFMSDEIYIHWCETAKEARGKNIYPIVLKKIADDYCDKKILIATSKNNKSSVHGIIKAGFKLVSIINIEVMCGISKINIEKEKMNYL